LVKHLNNICHRKLIKKTNYEAFGSINIKYCLIFIDSTFQQLGTRSSFPGQPAFQQVIKISHENRKQTWLSLKPKALPMVVAVKSLPPLPKVVIAPDFHP
jgi:hypothetical protein